MLEWYEAYADYNAIADELEELVSYVAEQVGYEGEIDFTKPWRRARLTDEIEAETGVDVMAVRGDSAGLVAAAEAKGITDLNPNETWAQLVDELLSKFVEPKITSPVFLMDYPVELSPFAKDHRSEAGLVERFECFAGGMEFANAFTELNDPDEQRVRFEQQVRHSEGGDDEAQPYDEDFVRALEHGMPPTGGIGIGIDRLVMLLGGKNTIREVVLWPAMR
jgi:lysyl-tRNA synthetase class 2